MPVITVSASPMDAEDDFYYCAKTASLLTPRPLSVLTDLTDMYETDFEDGSDHHDDNDDDDTASQKGSFELNERRRSQTTISSYDEAPTPSPRTSTGKRPFELCMRPVQGPKGPHLFRSSQISAEFNFDHALQMSPLLPNEHTFQRTDTAFSDNTLTPVTSRTFPFHSSLRRSQSDTVDPEAHIRAWSTQKVIDWMFETGIDASVIECFDVHDINGAVLLDLQFEDLKELEIQSFGKRHQLWNAICLLRGEEVTTISPQPTPFQDISRPCTSNTRRSPSRSRPTRADDDDRPVTPEGVNQRRARKGSKSTDVVMPAESVSIVAIEQLLPKLHTCSKGERCGKWRKQQRDIAQLHAEHGVGRFPISPTKGGHIFLAGNPGNAPTAENMIQNVYLQQQEMQEDSSRPFSEVQPSVVASSDLLGPGQLPAFALQENFLSRLGARDPQDNVKQFLQFQHMNSPTVEESPAAPLSPPYEMFPSKSISPFPAQNRSTTPDSQWPREADNHHEQLHALPKLDIPRSTSAAPHFDSTRAVPSASGGTASPSPNMIYRLGTPASEMDIPLTAVPAVPISRDTSQSVPPGMQFRPQQKLGRPQSRLGAQDWRRPSMTLPAVKEGEVFPPRSSSDSAPRPSMSTTASSADVSSFRGSSVADPAHDVPEIKNFGYGPSCTHAGWMKKRQRTRMLRHEWQESHFRLKGTQLTQHASARMSSAPLDSINVDEYAVACSSLASSSKLAAAMKALHIRSASTDVDKSSSSSSSSSSGANARDPTAFAFQLVPTRLADGRKLALPSAGTASSSAKTHHFAVNSKDDRIEWMRELMIAKALQQKGKGYDVEVNGVQA